MRRGGLSLGLLAAALVLAALGSGTATRDTVEVATPTAKPLTATPGRAPTAPTDAPPTTLPLPPAFPTVTTASPHRNLVATVKGESIDVFGAPDEATPASWTLPNPRASGSEQVFLVIGARTGWLNVLVPVRPNGSTGWIRSADITLAGHDFSIVVELGAHKLTVFEGDAVWAEEPVGVGVETTPTPGGRFFTVELFASQKPAYGPYAYGLSGYSEVIYDFGGGDGQFGIHGTSDPSGIGSDVSNGCIRMNNDAITRLAETLPIGVPVEIRV